MTTPIGKVLDALTRGGFDPKATGAGTWESRCPVHNGDRRNLSIKEASGGTVLFKCHAHGCSAESVTATLGLTLADLFPEATRRNFQSPPPKGEPARKRKVWPTVKAAAKAFAPKLGEPTAWLYRDAAGAATMAVVRFDRTDPERTDPDTGEPVKLKQYRPFRRTPEGWECGDPPGPLPLFNLPALAATPRIYVVEGEKCVRVIERLGLTGTTSAHGAKSPGKGDWGPLGGKEVIILPDHDEPGESYARAVARLLGPLGCTVKVVRLADLWRTDEPMREGDDIADWSERGIPDQWEPDQARAFLEAAAGAAAPLDLGAVEAEPTEASGGSRGGLVTTCMADVKPEPIEWLEPGIIPRGKLVIVAGEGGLGKSSITLEWAARVSRGQSLFGNPEVGRPPESTLLVSCEDGVGDTIVPRLIAAGADLKQIHKVDAVRGDDGEPAPFHLGRVAELDAELSRRPDLALVVIDPIGQFVGRSGIDDHRNSELSALLGPLTEAAEARRVTILIVAHFNKSMSNRAVHKIMGGVAYANTSRAAFAVCRDPDDPARRLLAPIKFNLGPEPPTLAYALRTLEEADCAAVLSGRSLPTCPRISAPRSAGNSSGWLGSGNPT
jgi:hypothetical protein